MQEISVHLKFATLAAAIAFLAAGEKVSPGAAIAGVGVEGVGTITTGTTDGEKINPEVKSAKKGKASAAPAAEASSAKQQEGAATQESATTVETSSPSTAETASEKKAEPELPVYDKTDLPARIKAIVAGRVKKDALIALLGEFDAKSGKDLKPEQIADFSTKLAALEAPEAPEEDLA